MAEKGDAPSSVRSLSSAARGGYWRGVMASLALAGIVALAATQRRRLRMGTAARRRKEVCRTSQDRHRDGV